MKRLLSTLKEKWPEYLLEGFVIVVSILLAIWLENWNEERKESKIETTILKEISQNLKTDLEDHRQNIKYLSTVVLSSKIVLNHMDSDFPYHDSLAHSFAWLPMAANFDPVASGYNHWLSEGVSVIKNPKLRNRISKIYEKEYKWLRSFLKDRQYIHNTPLQLYMTKKFEHFDFLNEAYPTDYSSLRRDTEFKTLVQLNAKTINAALENNLEIVGEIEVLIYDIQREIDQK